MMNVRGAYLATALGAAIFGGGMLVGSEAQAGTAVDMQVAQNFELNVFGGRHYCWYDNAWQGPGWYWCGYAWRNGYGWGGGYGWHNWHGGGYGRGGYGHGGYGHGGYGHGGYGHSGGHGHGNGHPGGHGHHH